MNQAVAAFFVMAKKYEGSTQCNNWCYPEAELGSIRHQCRRIALECIAGENVRAVVSPRCLLLNPTLDAEREPHTAQLLCWKPPAHCIGMRAKSPGQHAYLPEAGV
jgi:hypothetical protein